MVPGLRSRSLRSVLRTSRADTLPEPPDADGLVAADPGPPTLSRRGALALVGGGALLVAVLTAGQTLGGFTRRAAFLLPRGRSHGTGPNDFQINRTAAAAGIDAGRHRHQLAARRARSFGADAVEPDRPGLDAAAHRASCRSPASRAGRPRRPGAVSGWRDLAGVAGLPNPARRIVSSLERFGAFNHAVLQANQVLNPDSLLALRVNGADLSLDHGYPGAHHRARAARRAQHQMGRSIEFGQR